MNKRTAPPLISVIIPCRNEETVVSGILDDLAKQTFRDFEVIVVDSASSDKTAVVAASYHNRLSLHVAKADKAGLVLARHLGAAQAIGNYLLFADADVRLPSEFLEQTVSELLRRHLDVAGFQQRINSPSLGLRFGGRLMNGYVRLMSITPLPIFFSCFICRRELHDAIGGFDASLFIMEDYDYALRSKQAGGAFGIIKSTYFLASPRRYEQDGGKKIWQGIYGELYRYSHGLRVEKPLYQYTMGGKGTPEAPDRSTTTADKPKV